MEMTDLKGLELRKYRASMNTYLGIWVAISVQHKKLEKEARRPLALSSQLGVMTFTALASARDHIWLDPNHKKCVWLAGRGTSDNNRGHFAVGLYQFNYHLLKVFIEYLYIIHQALASSSIHHEQPYSTSYSQSCSVRRHHSPGPPQDQR
jgi:hypothetical protein